MNQGTKKRRALRPLDANALRPPVRDLFGEVPVSQRELMLWMWKVPAWMNRHARQCRIDGYLRGWDVAGKVARYKEAGELEAVFGDESCPHCGAALESDQPARLAALEAENAELRALLARPRAPVVPLRSVQTRPDSRRAVATRS